MSTVYNPLTGQWERIDDVVRPVPVIARDTRLVAVNDTRAFVPTLATNNTMGQTDIFGNSDSSRATVGIATGSTNVDFAIPDPWRIRRFIVVCQRGASGSTGVTISCSVWGRLLAPDGTPAAGWRWLGQSSDSAFNVSLPIRFVLPTTLAGVFGFDQYRIVFRRDLDSNPAPQLSLVRVYAEF